MITENEAVKKIENTIEEYMKDAVLYVCEFGYGDVDDFDAVGHDYACVYLLMDTAKDLGISIKYTEYKTIQNFIKPLISKYAWKTEYLDKIKSGEIKLPWEN